MNGDKRNYNIIFSWFTVFTKALEDLFRQICMKKNQNLKKKLTFLKKSNGDDGCYRGGGGLNNGGFL